MEKTYRLISDGGHGWLKIPHTDVTTSGIRNEITSYSYRSLKYAYLEEDYDASRFLKKMESDGYKINIDYVNIADFEIMRKKLQLKTYTESFIIDEFKKTLQLKTYTESFILDGCKS